MNTHEAHLKFCNSYNIFTELLQIGLRKKKLITVNKAFFIIREFSYHKPHVHNT